MKFKEHSTRDGRGVVARSCDSTIYSNVNYSYDNDDDSDT